MSIQTRAWIILSLCGITLACIVVLTIQQRMTVAMSADPMPGAVVPARMVTINGRDEQGGIIDPVNVWKDYANRGLGIAGRTHDGAQVELIQQQGSGAQIRLSDGTEGWVNKDFIKN